MRIQRALISVSDKTGIVSFARELAAMGVEILSTGGTAKLLTQEGVKCIEVSDYTGFPEMMDGRVKTLHPRIHGGLLKVRMSPEHTAAGVKHKIKDIDMVVVNLYPFEQTAEKPGATLGEMIEQIDIGGPSMLRSGAKNHESVTVVTDPTDYDKVLLEMRENEDGTTLGLRNWLAIKAFLRTFIYDLQIATSLLQNRNSNSVVVGMLKAVMAGARLAVNAIFGIR